MEPAHCPDCGAALDEQSGGVCHACLLLGAAGSEPAAGSIGTVGDFELLEVLARGGMGLVYRARQKEPAREVAIKSLPGAGMATPEMRQRFRLEAEVMARLEHPAILPVYELGEEDEVPWFAMKLARGGSLAERVASYRGKYRGAAQLMVQVAEAVQFAHSRGVLHRDLKPGNVLFDASGQCYVGDFGLAKLADDASGLTRTVMAMGTPKYMAPERLRDARAGATVGSDVWSLGVMLYELLAGAPPFQAESMTALFRQVESAEAPALPAEVPRDLRTIAAKVLAREPARRYATAGEFAADLQRWLRGEPVLARPVRTLERLVMWARRHPAVTVLTVLLTASLAVVVVLQFRTRAATLDRLRTSLLAQARAARTGIDTDRRAEALSALRQAARVAPGRDVQEEMITTLALPDFAETARLEWLQGRVPPAFTPDLQTVAEATAAGVIVRRRDGTVLSRLPPLPEAVEALGPFTPDGARLLIHAGRTTRLWNVRAGAWAMLLPGQQVIVRGTEEQISPDGNWLARNATVNGDDPVEIISLTSPLPLRSWPAPWPYSKVVGFSPDSKLLAVRGYARPEIIVMDPATGATVHSLRLPVTARTRCAAWSPDGRRLAVGTENFKIYLWRLAPDPLPPQLMGHMGNLTAVAWNHDGSRILSSAIEDSTRLWDTATATVLAQWPWHGRRILCSPDGSEFAADDEAGARTVFCRLHGPEVCREILVPHPDLDERGSAGSWCAEFSPNGRLLLAGDTLGVYLYDAATGAPAGHHPADYCWSVAFPDDQSYLAGTRGGLLRRSLDGRREDVFLPGDSNALTLAGPRLAVTAGRDLLTYENGVPQHHYCTAARLDAVALQPGGEWIAAGHRDTSGIALWSTGQTAAAPRILPAPGPAAIPRWTPDGRLLLIAAAEALHAVRPGSFSVVWQIPAVTPRQSPPLLALSADGQTGAALLEDGIITLFRPADGTMLTRLIHPRPRDIRSLSLTASGDRLAAMTHGHIIQLWDLGMLHQLLAGEGLGW